MKILYKKSFSKVFQLIGPLLALADNFYLLDIFFFLKSSMRMKIAVSRNKDIKIIAIVDNREELFRSKRILTKEPDTIGWIDYYFIPGEVFFDIGANIGAFSMYAGKKIKDLRVLAFEPHCQNFSKLNENIAANRLNKKVTAFPLALSKEDSVSLLCLSNLSSGFSDHQYNSELNQGGFHFEPAFRQGSAGFSLDSLVYKYGLPIPNHIKIDVDGNEILIIEGAKKILEEPVLRTILIELNIGQGCNPDKERQSKEIIKTLEGYNFKVVKISKVGSDQHSHNYIFSRSR